MRADPQSSVLISGYGEDHVIRQSVGLGKDAKVPVPKLDQTAAVRSDPNRALMVFINRMDRMFERPFADVYGVNLPWL